MGLADSSVLTMRKFKDRHNVTPLTVMKLQRLHSLMGKMENLMRVWNEDQTHREFF